jgi:hypothetical protein
MDYQPPTILSEANFLGHLIFGLVDATVDTTVCKGQILMQGKKILSMDEEADRSPFARACTSDVAKTGRTVIRPLTHTKNCPIKRGTVFCIQMESNQHVFRA